MELCSVTNTAVVGQLTVHCSFLGIKEDLGSNPVLGNFLNKYLHFVERTKIKKKELRETQ